MATEEECLRKLLAKAPDQPAGADSKQGREMEADWPSHQFSTPNTSQLEGPKLNKAPDITTARSVSFFLAGALEKTGAI